MKLRKKKKKNFSIHPFNLNCAITTTQKSLLCETNKLRIHLKTFLTFLIRQITKKYLLDRERVAQMDFFFS